MDVSEQEAKLTLRLAQLEKHERCQEDFLIFVKNMWPDFIAGRHHKIIAEVRACGKGGSEAVDY